LFYLGVIFNYFAPWCLAFFASLPFLGRNLIKKTEDRPALIFLMSWILASFFFFSGIFFVINHYLLAITVPFALLVSYFFLVPMNQRPWEEKFIGFIQTGVSLGLVVMSFMAFSFLYFFLNNGSGLGWGIVLAIYVVLLVTYWHNRKKWPAAVVLALSMIVLYSQSHLITQARLISISTLQQVSEVIKEDGKGVIYKVGVGSNDIHEKELQIYFKEKVEKVATSVDHQSRAMINEFFKSPEQVYCIFTEADWLVYEPHKLNKPLQKIGEDYIIRKRMRIDRHFFTALFKFERQRIHDYFMEKVFIFKKDSET
jgi:4-amino-4-deoxy-L-arabinose transferase-like glycosyltransferase